MAFPGIISCLHPVSTATALTCQLIQGQQSRAEGFWLPAALQQQAAQVLASLTDQCSLFLEQHMPSLPLRSHDGVLQQDGRLLLGNGSALLLAKTMGDGGLVPASALVDMAGWLAAGHQHFLCPAAVQPVARAILNIWPLDPYLARHYLLSFTPLLRDATLEDYLAVFQGRGSAAMAQPDWVQAYLKLEKKLHRAYLDH